MREGPDLNLLPVFVAVAETSSISGAARLLELPKSSVSRGVTTFERTLGVQLFHRTTRKLSLTTAGTAFYEKVRPLVSTLREVTGSLPEQEDAPSGTLRITTPMDMALSFLPQVLAEFLARYPGIKLDVRPTSQRVDLVAEGFDAALRASVGMESSTLMSRKLSPVQACLYATPGYLARRGQPRNAADAADHDWVICTRMRPQPPLVLPEKPRLLTDDLMFTHLAIRAGLGIGLVPEFLARRDVLSGQLVRILPRFERKDGTLFFVYPRTEHVPRKVTALRDFLLAYFTASPLGPPVDAGAAD